MPIFEKVCLELEYTLLQYLHKGNIACSVYGEFKGLYCILLSSSFKSLKAALTLTSPDRMMIGMLIPNMGISWTFTSVESLTDFFIRVAYSLFLI